MYLLQITYTEVLNSFLPFCECYKVTDLLTDRYKGQYDVPVYFNIEMTSIFTINCTCTPDQIIFQGW